MGARGNDIKHAVDHVNARDFDAASSAFAQNARFHLPGLGLDLQGRDTATARIKEVVEQGDFHYEFSDAVENGPFVVAFLTVTGMVEGQRMSWPVCQVYRYEGNSIAEVWGLRGGQPEPAH
jgi:hypothetical protein